MNQSPQQNERMIRVFISSTFRDMKAERDHLVKFTFPQLRRLCESRGVIWGEVDLRWGVTDEEAAEGKVLPICLEEIKRCRPYFIGLLGERYGWVPQTIPDDLIAHQPWLEQHRYRSVTELEIIHGVLRNEDMHQHACFYFRDPGFVANMPEENKAYYASESPEFAGKLRRLKDDIRHAQEEQICQLRESFTSPEELGSWVLDDFTKIINDLWPEGSQPSELERDRLDHDSYARNRAQVYVGREEYFQRLDQHAADNGDKALVVVGESGSGKSALLANWAIRYRQAHPGALVIQHYIGASPQSAEWSAMLQRIMGEFKKRLGVEAEIPGDTQKLRDEFPIWLQRAAAKDRVILILDALNQLADTDGAPDLVWLLPVLPWNVRLFVSTLPGRALDAIRRRRWLEMSVQSLSLEERTALIDKYLGNRSKKLSDVRRQRIVAAPQSANPLYLRVLLDELCVTAEHEKLDERIDHYLSAPTPTELYEKVLVRWEEDYGPALVRDSLSLVSASRRGLAEAEILELLGKNRQPLPRATWTPFLLAAESSLVSQNGLLKLSHRYVSESVTKRYHQNEEDVLHAHVKLADYFASQPLLFRFREEKQNRDVSPLFCGDTILDAVDHVAPRPYNRRKIEEQLWQAQVANDWRKLSLLLSDLLFFQAVWDHCHEDVERFWEQMDAHAVAAMPRAYEGIIRNPDKYSTRLLWAIGRLLSENGFPSEAIAIQRCIVTRTKELRAQNILAVSNLAQTLTRIAQPEQALDLAKKVCDEMVQDGLSFACAPLRFEIGRILHERKNYNEAIRQLREASLLCRTGMQWSSDLMGQILVYRALAHGHIGEMDAAVRLASQAVEEMRRGESRRLLAWALTMAGLILKSADEPDAARISWREAQSLYTDLHDDLAAKQLSERLSALRIDNKQ